MTASNLNLGLPLIGRSPMEPITERWNQFVSRIQNAIVTCSVYGGPAGAVSAVVPQLLNGHGLRSGGGCEAREVAPEALIYHADVSLGRGG